MASVSSLDQDMRNLRMSRYTPQAANDARAWIESSLGDSLPSGDLLEALKDGVALCRLANLAVQPHHAAIKFKASPMPFIQMENISHFLRACEMPPLNLPAHDRFLTVDLFEQKDPAQVLQCLGAFSRQANRLHPSRFPTTIGPKKPGVAMSPTATGGNTAPTNGGTFRRPPSPTKPSTTLPSANLIGRTPMVSSSTSQANGLSNKPASGLVSSWSKQSDEGNTAPAWNIHQYGYMGGASQGNQGISFGARRQITSQAPSVPSLAEKERLRKEQEREAERQRQYQADEQLRKQRIVEEEEQKARTEQEQRWEEEARKQREEDRRQLQSQKREWEEQERRWKEEEETRRNEDVALQASMSQKAQEKPRAPDLGMFKGQTLAGNHTEQASLSSGGGIKEAHAGTPEQRRVRELEQQLEEARERERQYQAEREERLRKEQPDSPRPGSASTARPESAHESEVSWVADEREHLRQQSQSVHDSPASRPAETGAQRPLPSQPQAPPWLPRRPLPEPTAAKPASEPKAPTLPARSQPSPSPFGTRPLPIPTNRPDLFGPEQRKPNRADQFLATNTAPLSQGPRISSAQETGDTSLEQAKLQDQRIASQDKTKAGGWASKSLLEREMERERERQREWEASQQAMKNAARDTSQGTGEGQTWDVNQYGYMGGDSMNKGSSVGSGINIGGRRQIIGPRPPK